MICAICVICVSSGCGVSTATERDDEIAAAIEGRWRGAPIDPPERTWLADGVWDVWFSPSGDFSVVVKYGVAAPELRMAAEYRLFHGALYIDHATFAGPWQVETNGGNEVVLRRGELAVRLRREPGT